jgi:adenylate kinase family enzyme
MTRVAFIGNAGGGKSTLSRNLGRARDLPMYPIDQLQWRPGWMPVPPDDFARQHDALLAQERWIIDGWGP